MVIFPEISGVCGSSKFVFLAIAIFLIVLAVFLYFVSTYKKENFKIRYAAMASLCLGAICLAVYSICGV